MIHPNPFYQIHIQVFVVRKFNMLITVEDCGWEKYIIRSIQVMPILHFNSEPDKLINIVCIVFYDCRMILMYSVCSGTSVKTVSTSCHIHICIAFCLTSPLAVLLLSCINFPLLLFNPML